MRFLSNITFLIAILGTAAGCGGTAPPLQPPPPDPKLEMSCPAPIVRDATSPQGADVQFDPPAPTGGRTPYVVECVPGSGTLFAVGETPVLCTATDANMAQTSCGFGITVQVPRTIAKIKFTAFGDSITEGTVSLAPLVMLGAPDTYPFKLEQMLRERYPSQAIVVSNQGQGGRQTNQDVLRLPSVLDSERPDVLLLLEGINAIRSLSASRQEGYLRTMITDARKRNVDVIIATVMPVAADGKLQPASEYMTAIRALNTRIVSLALEQSIGNVVDLFGLFDANMHLLGADGLHPTIEGQTRIAEAFRDEIVRRYGSDATTSLRVPMPTFGFSRVRSVR